jgi:hypothetical protein
MDHITLDLINLFVWGADKWLLIGFRSSWLFEFGEFFSWIIFAEAIIIIEELFPLFDFSSGKEENSNTVIDDDS